MKRRQPRRGREAKSPPQNVSHQSPRRAEGRGPAAQGRLGRHAGAVPDRQEIGRRRPRGRLDRAASPARATRTTGITIATSSSSCSRASGTSTPTNGEEPSGEGDVVYSPRGCWHGFNNTSNEDVVLVWGWMGAGSIEASGYEVHPESHRDGRTPGTIRASHAACARSSPSGASGSRPATRRSAGRSASARRRRWRSCASTAPLVGFLMRQRAGANPARPSRSRAGPSRWPSRRSRSTWARTFRGGGDRDGGRRGDRRDRPGDRACRPRPAARRRGSDPRRQHLPAPRDARAARCRARRRRSSTGVTGPRLPARRGGGAAPPIRRPTPARSSTSSRHVADVLAAFGERLRAGDVIITGSIVPPLLVEPDETESPMRSIRSAAVGAFTPLTVLGNKTPILFWLPHSQRTACGYSVKLKRFARDATVPSTATIR